VYIPVGSSSRVAPLKTKWSFQNGTFGGFTGLPCPFFRCIRAASGLPVSLSTTRTSSCPSAAAAWQAASDASAAKRAKVHTVVIGRMNMAAVSLWILYSITAAKRRTKAPMCPARDSGKKA
jgi:hypothetical protein